MVMTVLLTDAKHVLGPVADEVNDLVYADDTLVVAAGEDRAADYMRAISDAGANYGLRYNWRKLEVLPVRCQASISKPDGQPVVQKESIVYLGAVLSSNGNIDAELSRRLGAARSEFDKLARIWSHSTLSAYKKVNIFNACVISKLLYSLHTAWLKKTELSKLDAFQACCLRKVLGIPHSYIRHVTNSSVLGQARQSRLSQILLERQLTLLGKIARMGDGHPVRGCLFKPGTVELRIPPSVRRRGRPRQVWAREVYKHAVHACVQRSVNWSEVAAMPASVWKSTAREYSRSR